jgi:hypothetical protein
VVFVVQAGYHLFDALALRRELEKSGRGLALVAPAPPADLLKRFRASWARFGELREVSRKHGIVSSEPVPVVIEGASALIVRNDWGPTRSLVVEAQRVGTPTIGWVEGVQDFRDVDTGRQRHAYRTVDHVWCLGEHDAAELAGLDVTAIGSERMWSLWHGPPSSGDVPLVANVNFTYGVFESARTAWVRAVRSAATSTETRLTITRHPADKGRVGWRMEASESADVLLSRTRRLVSRFSTLIYDALLLGVDVIYFNPHGENVPTFADPMEAFTVARTRSDLAAALRAPPPEPGDVRQQATSFLRHHLVLEGPRPAVRAAEMLSLLGRGSS